MILIIQTIADIADLLLRTHDKKEIFIVGGLRTEERDIIVLSGKS